MGIRYDTVQITIIYTPLNYCQFHYRMIITADKSLTTNLLTCKCSFCPSIAQIIMIRQASTSISAIHDKLYNQINTSSNVPAFPLSSEDTAVFGNCITTSIFTAADQSTLQTVSLCRSSLPRYSFDNIREARGKGADAVRATPCVQTCKYNIPPVPTNNARNACSSKNLV